MGSIRAATALAMIASSASGQSALAACGDVPDSTARQTIVSAGDLKVCLLAMRADPADSTPRRWATRSRVVILETQRPNDFRRLALDDRATAWTINGKPAPFDSTAEEWQRVVIDVLDAAWAARRLVAMVDDLLATDVPLPTNADSAKAQLAVIERQINLTQSKIVAATTKWERAQTELRRAPRSATGTNDYERAEVYARNELMVLQSNMQVLKARKDLVQLQLERLDPSNADTKARQSAADEVKSRRAAVEDDLYLALARLREILGR